MRLAALLIALSTSGLAYSQTEAVINGVPGLGRLRLDQVCFAGSHNAGAGFRGVMKYRTGVPVIGELYANQTLSFMEQLELGVRYFDIDTMWHTPAPHHDEWWGEAGAWTGHGDAYAGPVAEVLRQVQTWMDEEANRNEVVVLQFSDNVRDKANHADDIAADMLLQLYALFGPGSIARRKERGVARPVTLGSRPDAETGREGGAGPWPELSHSIASGERLFVFLHASLVEGAGHTLARTESDALVCALTWGIENTTCQGPWNADRFSVAEKRALDGIVYEPRSRADIANAYTGSRVFTSASVREVLLGNADKCNTDAEFVRLSLFTSYGRSMNGMAELSALHLAETCARAEAVRDRSRPAATRPPESLSPGLLESWKRTTSKLDYSGREASRSVNFLLVDRNGSGGEGRGSNNTMRLARSLNVRTLAREGLWAGAAPDPVCDYE